MAAGTIYLSYQPDQQHDQQDVAAAPRAGDDAVGADIQMLMLL